MILQSQEGDCNKEGQGNKKIHFNWVLTDEQEFIR